MKELVKMINITKRFPGVVANDRVNFDLREGEIHGLLGENGAGKTTLMNMLSGLLKPDEGEIWIKGMNVKFRSPKDAIDMGVFMVHQHFMLIPNFTVAENIILGAKSPHEFLLNMKEVEERIAKISNEYGLEINPKAYVWQLSAGERQRVEILKALYRDIDILILDEPTSNLAPIEVESLFRMLKRIKEERKSVILITHKIYETLGVCDRITVLRRGKVVGTLRREEADEQHLVRMMVGEEYIKEIIQKTNNPAYNIGCNTKPLLEVHGLSVNNDLNATVVSDISFTLYPGEILAIAGVAGNGQSELIEALTGLRKPVKGRILFDGVVITGSLPSQLYKMGIYHIPEKRIEMGVSLERSFAENLILGYHSTYAKKFLLDFNLIREHSRNFIQAFNIKVPDEKSPVAILSGGNIQRLILARGIMRRPKLLIANQPTAGLDIAATNFVHSKILELRNNGSGILLVSTDLDEILKISDRIMVMYKGRCAGILNNAEATKEKVAVMMMGGKNLGDNN